MQLTQEIEPEHRNTHKTVTAKNDVRRPAKILTLISRILASLALVLALALESKSLALALRPKSLLTSLQKYRQQC